MVAAKNLWQELLAGGAVKKVEINRRAGRCCIWLDSSRHLEPDALTACREFLAGEFPGFTFTINQEEAPAPVDLETLITEQRAALLAKVARTLGNGSAAWLAGARLEIKGDKLHLILPAPLAVEALKARRGDAVLQEVLARYGYQVVVELSVDDDYQQELLSTSRQLQDRQLEQVRREEPAASKPRTSTGKGPADGLLHGKKITAAPRPLKDIQEEEKQVTVQGEVLSFDTRQLKSGRWLASFDLTDYTDSISVKAFIDQGPLTENGLAPGDWVLVQGPVQYDRYSQELALIADAVARGERPVREDREPEKRVELHLHTKMSAMDGITEVAAAVQQAAYWGHGAIAFTDHGVVQAFPAAAEAGRKYGVKIIYGLEGYLFDQDNQPLDRQPTYHIILLVKNQEGLANLYRLVSRAHLDYFYRKPRLPRSLLQEHRDGLLLGTACEAGELIRSYLAGADAARLEEIASFYDFLEIQPLANNDFLIRQGQVADRQALMDMNRQIVALGEKLGKPVVATGDVHFLNPEDALYRQVLLAGQGYADEVQAPLYYRTTAEMLAEFDYLDTETARRVVITNPRLIADQVEELKPIPDEFYPPEIPGAEEELTRIVMDRAHEWYGDPLPEVVQARLDKEMQAIIGHGFAVLYLIAHKLVRKSNEDGYLVGSRGSVGSSLVATMAGITEVNPLPPHYRCPSCHYSEFVTGRSARCGADLPARDCPRCGAKLLKDGHDIPFEVFLGFKGDKVPDIDLNFSGEYQPRAHQYTETIFGKDHVFRAGTIATLAERTAFGFVHKFLEEKGLKARQAEINRLVKGITGVKRTTGQHPGGLMVVPKGVDMHQFTPLQHPADDTGSGTITTHFDYHSISSRLVKLDLLGHDDPTVIKMLEDLTGVNPREIPLDEPRTMSLFSSVEALGVKPEDIGAQVGTLGIPEFGTRFVRQMLEDTRPRTFAELVRISGFSHGTDVWLNNAQDLIKSGTAKLYEAISTRDDIMNYLMEHGVVADIAFRTMEDVRKGKGVKKEYEEAIRAAGIPDWFLQSCKKISYLFPKAHAVAYVTMAFRIAYFKVYYPEAFYASFFSIRADEFDADIVAAGLARVQEEIAALEKKGNEATAREKNILTILEVAREMYYRGITLERIDLEKSTANRFLVEPGRLLPPLGALSGVGQAAAEAIVRARQERPFTSIEDLQYRSRVSKTVIEALEKHGALADLPASDQLAFFG
ncbi:PolC-type DNA polymerase III [Moorella sp. Hama-1]|uniref:PolC-type DNA polymerase III n=1 Tax=Moorella sp. Hama-1 TaxID=2138101 RepID=UPI000D6543B0|nr:PolC-type DNA polymerase III [Moorella sp. Hama-1]MDN5362312.1 polymerase subunit alpha, Gram-positive type [Moorella sp. (in: firmicutes)]BCV21128.1 DNA polymerase III PolC-type [Moorella sp. Hama-1]